MPYPALPWSEFKRRVDLLGLHPFLDIVQGVLQRGIGAEDFAHTWKRVNGRWAWGPLSHAFTTATLVVLPFGNMTHAGIAVSCCWWYHSGSPANSQRIVPLSTIAIPRSPGAKGPMLG